MSIAELRREYGRTGLNEADLAADPIAQLRRWLDEAVAAGVTDPTAMVLATATSNGIPSARVILLKGLDSRGLAFFTNYRSRKAQELTGNPHAAATFYWPDIDRQVRVEGFVSLVDGTESDQYFQLRPVDSQLAAWASNQSEPLAGGRPELDRRYQEIAKRFTGGAVPRPPFWGGYRIEPITMEFWQGRHSRLHDRLRYSLVAGRWVIERLAP
jgi:pyridoxamine 5'-phosphate oxidase